MNNNIKVLKKSEESKLGKQKPFSDYRQELVDLVLRVTTEIFSVIKNLEQYDSSLAFKKQTDTNGKQSYTVDLVAEAWFRYILSKEWKNTLETRLGKIVIVGEESLDIKPTKGTIMCLVDTIDGTDLFIRNLGNWAIAFTLFSSKDILATVVGVPNFNGGIDIFYSVDPGQVFFKSTDENVKLVSGGSGLKDLSQASLCYYGQKYLNADLKDHLPGLKEFLANEASSGKEIRFRNYNLSGIPMVTKAIHDTGHEQIDIILQTHAQMPHDAIPGLILGMRTGLIIINLDTFQPFTEDEVIEVLLNPKQARVRYVIAATKELAEQVIQCLGSNPKVLN